MEWIRIIQNAIDDIEADLCGDISADIIATNQHVSSYYFQKMFSALCDITVTEYIRNRRLSEEAFEIKKDETKTILDVALKYGFDSHEGFTRSFTKVFGSTPSTARKYLISYHVPEWMVPDTGKRSMRMGLDKSTLFENMHQIVFEILRTSLEEVDAGYCTEIAITLLQDGRIRISDNGRGIPLSKSTHVSKTVLDKILAGHPISSAEYAEMGDFSQCSMQTVNSLCESLQINVYRNGMWFQQDYVRGIAQHDVICKEQEHLSGTEMVLKPDRQIFGDTEFSVEVIKDWVQENIADRVKVVIDGTFRKS